jgi:sugar (pentulose or hexulose) kinase
MSEKNVLAIDFGTQSVRAIIFDKTGEIKGKCKVAFEPYFSLANGFAEQHPEYYFENLVRAIKGVKKENPEEFKKVAGVGVTTIRDTITFVDKDLKPLRPFLLWLDERECKRVEEAFPLSYRILFKLLGICEMVMMQRRVTKLNWVNENEPEIWNKTHKIIQLSGYITYMLTGNLVDSVASQIGHLPFDYKTKTWQNEKSLTRFLVDCTSAMMVDLKKPGEVLGYITSEAAKATGLAEGLPVIACGSDKGCETFGTGTLKDDAASLSFGTTATVQLMTDKYVEPQTFLPAYPAVVEGKYNPEGQIFRGYWMVTWFKNQFGSEEVRRAAETGRSAEELLDELLDKAPPGCEGLVLQPYWSPGIKTPFAKGSIVGFSDVHTKAHLYRAIIEGIGLGLYDNLKSLEKRSGHNVKRVMVSGGGSVSDRVCQITADISGLPVQKIQTYETCSLGAAMLTYIGLNEFKSPEDAIANMVHIGKTYQPDMKVHELYMDLYNMVFKKVFPCVKNVCKGVREFNKKYPVKK